MKKIVLLIVFISILIVPTVSALEIIPDEINTTITPGEYLIITMLISNTENHPLNITLQSSLSLVFSPSSLVLRANNTGTVLIYVFEEIHQEGSIIVDYSEGQIEIPVVIAVNSSVNYIDSNITIFPSNPVSGKMFAIFLDEPVDTSGFLWIHDDMYPLEIKNGFTSVQTDENIYGDAMLWIYGKGFTKTFEIECGLKGTPSFKILDIITVGESGDIQLMVGDKPIIDAEVYLQDPDDVEYVLMTDSNGEIHQTFDKPGTWKLGSMFKNERIVDDIVVNYKPLGVTVNKYSYNTGEPVAIQCGDSNVELFIKKNNVLVTQTTISTGNYEYIPEKSGVYTVEALSENKKGTTTFTVNMPTTIRILDGNNMQTTILKENQNYIIQVLDENGQLIPQYEQVYTTNGPVVINDGLGFWRPTESGTIRLTVEDAGEYIGSELLVTIESEPPYLLIAGGVMLCFVFIIGLLFIPRFIKSGKIPFPKRKGNRKLPDLEQIL